MDNRLRVVLASTSPYRKELLDQLKIPYTVVAPHFEEYFNETLSPAELVTELSIGKARSVAHQFTDAIIIGSDQVYEFEGIVGSKAENKEEAFLMLQRMRGKTQRFFTGYCLLDTRSNREYTGVEVIRVQLRNYTDEAIQQYIETGEAMDCAGSIKVEGKGVAFIERIEGDYFSLRGLPLIQVVHKLIHLGVPII
jgi:septum formation protein